MITNCTRGNYSRLSNSFQFWFVLGHMFLIPVWNNLLCFIGTLYGLSRIEIPVTPTHPIERVTVTHELPVPKSPEVVSSVNHDCHNDGSIDCDLFPGVTAFRRRFISNFIFAHLNVNSYRHKYISIHDILAKQHVDYLAISESKLDDSFPSAQFPAHDYPLYRQDVSSSSGGLLVYVRADLPHRRLNHAKINVEGFESLCMEITVGKTTTILSCIYKHPKLKNDVFKCYFSNMADSLLRTHSDLVFLGYELLSNKKYRNSIFLWHLWVY